MTDVERTLKSLNGYHEEILEALQASAHGLTSLDHSTGRPSPGADVKKSFGDTVDYGGRSWWWHRKKEDPNQMNSFMYLYTNRSIWCMM